MCVFKPKTDSVATLLKGLVFFSGHGLHSIRLTSVSLRSSKARRVRRLYLNATAFYSLCPDVCSLFFHFFILNVFDSGHVGYCKKKKKHYFCLKPWIKTICRRVTHSPNPTFLYLVSPCFRFLVNPVVINTCV